jgi:hypothetical protein
MTVLSIVEEKYIRSGLHNSAAGGGQYMKRINSLRRNTFAVTRVRFEGGDNWVAF